MQATDTGLLFIRCSLRLSVLHFKPPIHTSRVCIRLSGPMRQVQVTARPGGVIPPAVASELTFTPKQLWKPLKRLCDILVSPHRSEMVLILLCTHSNEAYFRFEDRLDSFQVDQTSLETAFYGAD